MIPSNWHGQICYPNRLQSIYASSNSFATNNNLPHPNDCKLNMLLLSSVEEFKNFILQERPTANNLENNEESRINDNTRNITPQNLEFINQIINQ